MKNLYNASMADDFSKQYKRLNKEQKEAVDSIEGPVMVIAGPGTGKTTILTLRIANILKKTDTPPNAILALTFTESGVSVMRQKLSKIIGPLSYRVCIRTFHSFANELINTYPEYFQNIIGRQHIDEFDERRLMQEVIDKSNLQLLRPRNDPLYYVRPALSAIKELKQENISPLEFKMLVKSEEKVLNNADDAYHTKGKFKGQMTGKHSLKVGRLEKNKELIKVYENYEKKLADRKFFDFEDMLMEAVRVLAENRDLRLRVQEEYLYLLADEHQDANNAENKLLEILSSFHDNPNLFIVGDEKQAIFRFQGASLENFLYFKRAYKNAKVIILRQNYRSNQFLLDAAHSLITNNPISDKSLILPLFADKKASKKIIIKVSQNRQSEIFFISKKVQELVFSGVEPEKIAVLVRENKDTLPIEAALKKYGLPTVRLGGSDVFTNVRIDALLSFLNALIDVSDENLAPVLFYDFLELNPHEVAMLIQEARNKKRPVILELRANDKFIKVADKLAHLSSVARNHDLVRAFNEIVEESGFLKGQFKESDALEILALYEKLLRFVERYAEMNKLAKIADFLSYLKEAKEHDIKLASEAQSSGGVSIMTAHRAKGLEFDYVFIAHVNDGTWGGRRSLSLFDLPILGGMEDHETEDERRLFYVALTRAKSDVFVSYHLSGEDNRDRLPSRFVGEIDSALIEYAKDEALDKEILNERAVKPKIPQLLNDKKYLNQLFISRGLSVTHLNNYLKCPWHYFFVDLLRIPESQSAPLIFGSAIHAALKAYFDAYAKEEDISVEAAFLVFERKITRSYLSPSDAEAHTREGKDELKKYLNAWDFSRSIFNEYRIEGVSIISDTDQEIKLNGSLDKIEILSGNVVNVVDYKTGKPKSRNEIVGKTKNADGNYKRQLEFYKLLLDLEGKWNMKSGTIDFVKPDEKGTSRREVFEVEESSVRQLERDIIRVSEEILGLTFWQKKCEQKDCRFCALSELLAQK